MVTLPKQTKKGFTIIEVVLVLAVAGLIFLMVFIAFPALQRAQQNSQRTNDMASVQSALISWQSNHSNNLPGPTTGAEYVEFNTTDGTVVDSNTSEIQCSSSPSASGSSVNRACQFVRDYMNAAATTDTGGKVYDTFKDPSGEFYNFVITKNISGNSSATPSFNFENQNNNANMSLEGDPANGITLSGTIDAYVMVVIPGATCKEDMAVRSQKNNFAVLYMLDGSGTKCTNNGS